MLRSKGPSGKHTKLHTVAASNNWNHTPYFVPRTCGCYPWRTSRLWYCTSHMRRHADRTASASAHLRSSRMSWLICQTIPQPKTSLMTRQLRNFGFIWSAQVLMFLKLHSACFCLLFAHIYAGPASQQYFNKSTYRNRLELEDDCKMCSVRNFSYG